MNTDLINKIIRFRVDLLGTSEDTKPLDAPDTSTFYEVDTYKFFIKYGGEWIEQFATSEDEQNEDDNNGGNDDNGGDDEPPANNESR